MNNKTKRSLFYFICLISGFLTMFGAVLPGAVIAGQKAVCINVASDYSSGAFSVVSPNVGEDGSREVTNDINPTISDLGLNAYGRYFYVIERYMGDNITKYDITDPSTPIWQYSVIDEADTVSTTNPHSIIFASRNKAYVIRHNTSTAWIVNPEAADESEFKIGTLDLSAYNDQDDYGPEMTSGVVVNGKLFIIMQRLNQNDNWSSNDAYIAVFDTSTDLEINTGTSEGYNGILLPIRNPSKIVYEPFNNLIYVVGQGKYQSTYSGTPAEYSGGIATVNPATYAANLLVDDGDDDSHPYGNFSYMAVHSPEKGYFVGYAAYGDNTLYGFNPSTGDVTGEVTDLLKNISVSGVTAGITGDLNGKVWVGDSTNGQLIIIDPDTDTVEDIVSTNLNPQKIVFANDDIFEARVYDTDLYINWEFMYDMTGYMLYLTLPSGDGAYLNLAAYGNPTKMAISNIPSGYTVDAYLVGTTTDGSEITSNTVTVSIP